MTINSSSEANLEREKEGVAASSAEVDNSQNHFKVSTEKNELDEVGEEEFEDNLEPDSDDDCPEFEGYVKTFNNFASYLYLYRGEPRGRLYPPVAGQGPGPKPGRPYQPK